MAVSQFSKRHQTQTHSQEFVRHLTTSQRNALRLLVQHDLQALWQALGLTHKHNGGQHDETRSK